MLAHQIVSVRHIPGCLNLVGDGLSRRDEGLPHDINDGSDWTVIPDWEEARGLQYNLFSVSNTTSNLHTELFESFANERVFIEVIDSLLGITGASTESKRKRAAHRAEGYFIEGNKLWRLGGSTLNRASARRECITTKEATQLAREEHAKLHMHQDHI